MEIGNARKTRCEEGVGKNGEEEDEAKWIMNIECDELDELLVDNSPE